MFFKNLKSLNNEKIFLLKSGFSIAKYEAVIIGLANFHSWQQDKETQKVISEKIDEIDTQPWFQELKRFSVTRRLKVFLDNNKVKNYFVNTSA